MQPSCPNLAQPGRAPARPRRLTGGPRLSAAALSHALSLSLAHCLVGPTCRRRFLHPRAPPLSLSRGPGSPVAESLPRASPFLSLSRGPVLSDPPLAVDRRVRTHARRRISRPRRPPMRPAPFLEPCQCPALAPRLISRSSALSRPLPTPPAAAGDPCPRSRPSSSLEIAPGLLEVRPEVRLPPPCLFYLICDCF
jgi:hypothetical protein